jgi:hypothetical protein
LTLNAAGNKAATALDNGTLALGAGASLTLTGALTGGGAVKIGSGATLTLNAAGNKAGTVVDNGVVGLAANAQLTVTKLVDPSSTGQFRLNTSSQLEIAVDQGKSNSINFLGAGELVIDAVGKWGNNIGTSSYTGPVIDSFVAGDKIDLVNFAFGAITDTYTAATGLLQLHNGSASATLKFDNSTLGSTNFHFASHGTGTQITLAIG